MTEKLMTAEEVLAEAELYATPAIMKAINTYFQRTGKMPGVVLRDLELEEVVTVTYRKKKK